jgi:hypothetical protein
MMFKDYRSAYEEFKTKAKKEIAKNGLSKQKASSLIGFDIDDFSAYYKIELMESKKRKEIMSGSRFLSELNWYLGRRPFFNVYPLIEKKFYEMSDELDMTELVMPMPALEVRTIRRTMLLADFGESFMLTVELCNDGKIYQEFRIQKKQKIKNITKNVIVTEEKAWNRAPLHERYLLNTDELKRLFFLAAGICMLEKNSEIITPVMLNKHRSENPTPFEIAKYAEKAIKRTGRIGFEVGREIERMKATVHYRNGCLAKYYVGKTHECYPLNAVSSTVPIIKWRSGSVVNRGCVPSIPTGYKDEMASK